MQFVATYMTNSEDGYTEDHFPMKPCTDEEFAKFWEFESAQEDKIRNLKEHDLLYCFDSSKYHDHKLYNTWLSDTNYGGMEVSVIACASQYVAFDGTIHGGGDE